MAAARPVIAVIGVTAAFGVLAAMAPALAAAPPTARDDAVELLSGSGPVSVDVLANDVDPDGDGLTVTGVSDGTTDGAVVTWNPAGFVGVHRIHYTVTDGQNEVDATLSVTVTPDPGDPPVAVDDHAKVSINDNVVIHVLSNDSDPEHASLTLTEVVAPAANGSTMVEGNTIRYRPDHGYVGVDMLRYEVTDGVNATEADVAITVNKAINVPPVTAPDTAGTRWQTTVRINVLANDTDADGDDLTVSAVTQPNRGTVEIGSTGNFVRYTPRGQFLGSTTFTYTADDGRGGTATQTSTVNVRPLYQATVTRPKKAVALRPTQIQGKITSRLGGPVAVKVQKRTDKGGWLLIKNTRVNSDNRFHARWAPQQPGRERFRAVATWEDGHRDTSNVFGLRVVAKFDPVVSRVTRKDVPHTWRPGCPVHPTSLRKIRMNFWDYNKKLQRGTLIGASWATSDYVAVFRRAFADKFRIKKMYPADRYGGDDIKAMRAGDTSAFNCRHVTGNPYRMSRHSWGDAIDINTFENPYVTGSRVYPAAAALRYYHRRSQHLRDPGVITSRSPIARALYAHNWYWGARWSPPDFQHWSRTGA